MVQQFEAKVNEATFKASVEPKLLDIAAAMKKVRQLDKIYFYFKPVSGEDRLVKQASFKKTAGKTLRDVTAETLQDVRLDFGLDQSNKSSIEVTKKQLMLTFPKSFAKSAASKGTAPVFNLLKFQEM
jgi:hypothetical protein